MGLFDIFRPKTAMHEKLLYTQKSRISSLEKDLEELKQAIRLKESEIKEMRTNFDKGKERLVDQIIDLSDKFADISDMVAKVHHENGRLKSVVESKRALLEHKESGKKKK